MKAKIKFAVRNVYTSTFEERPQIVGYEAVITLVGSIEKKKFVESLKSNLGKLGLVLMKHTRVRVPDLDEAIMLTTDFTVELTAEVAVDVPLMSASKAEQEAAKHIAAEKRGYGAGIVYSAIYITIEQLIAESGP